MIARLLCIVRLGHSWETVQDPAGSFARCMRCGLLRHDDDPSVHGGGGGDFGVGGEGQGGGALPPV